MILLTGIEDEYAVVVEGAKPHSIDPRVIGSQVVASHPEALAPLGVNTYGSPVDGMLSNGARLYDDSGHPEYSTPECREVRTLVACDKAGERLMATCCERFASTVPSGWRVALFKNNTNYAGNTWGCHENYLTSPALFEKLIVEQGYELQSGLVPFLVTRQLVAGAGRVGGEGGWLGFQLSQRPDFIRTVIGAETTTNRPIVNTRDEPLADRTRFRRLHLVLGDANMSEFATFLKVGTTRLVLRMLESGFWRQDLALADPVAAIQTISRDPFTPVLLANGRRFTAADIQSVYCEQAAIYLKDAEASPEENQLLGEWWRVLDAFRSDPLSLRDRLDWAIKLAFLNNARAEERLDWDAPMLKALDIRYHDIRTDQSIFYALVNQGLVRRLMPDDSEIIYYTAHPPANTRARARTEGLQIQADHVVRAHWHYSISQTRQLDWPDPTSPL